jgi:hypothetical protein
VQTARAVISLLCCVVVAAAIGVPAARAQRRAPSELARSLAQQKIDSRLAYEIARRRPDARTRQAARRQTGVKVDRHGRAYVDVHATVSQPLQTKIAALGGRITATAPSAGSIVAWIPLLTIERLAADRTVYSIEPAAAPN